MEFEERKRSSRDARTNSKSKIVLAFLCVVDQKRSKNGKREIYLKICEDMWKEREEEISMMLKPGLVLNTDAGDISASSSSSSRSFLLCPENSIVERIPIICLACMLFY